MPRTSDKRERLVEAAGQLIHHQGFNQTTLADIAETSGVPLGNVYYYFKTKEDIAAAVIADRSAYIRNLMREWERDPDPKQRLRTYLDFAIGLRETLAAHGCPIGSLCQELDKERNPIADQADALLKEILDWVTEQFRLLGDADPQDLAVQFTAALQGTVVVAHALHDPRVIDKQLEHLQAWLEGV